MERKSRNLSTAGAYEGEILQLAAYCLLVEEHFGRPVLSGRLLCQNRSLDVRFDDRLRTKLHNALHALHEADALEEVPRCLASKTLTKIPGADGYRAECDHGGNALEQTLVVVEECLVPRHINSPVGSRTGAVAP